MMLNGYQELFSGLNTNRLNIKLAYLTIIATTWLQHRISGDYGIADKIRSGLSSYGIGLANGKPIGGLTHAIISITHESYELGFLPHSYSIFTRNNYATQNKFLAHIKRLVYSSTYGEIINGHDVKLRIDNNSIGYDTIYVPKLRYTITFVCGLGRSAKR